MAGPGGFSISPSACALRPGGAVADPDGPDSPGVACSRHDFEKGTCVPVGDGSARLPERRALPVRDGASPLERRADPRLPCPRSCAIPGALLPEPPPLRLPAAPPAWESRYPAPPSRTAPKRTIPKTSIQTEWRYEECTAEKTGIRSNVRVRSVPKVVRRAPSLE